MLRASREAISSEESFRCIVPPDTPPGTFAVQTQRDTYLTVADADANALSSSASGPTAASLPEARGDATEVSDSTAVRIRMQARFKPHLKASKAERAREKISRRQLEAAVGRRLDEDEVRRLKRARREGNYHEAVLDVRVKGKHDKFAW